jgi:hypothetical protein
MKPLKRTPLRPLSSTAQTFEELEEIRARLVDAQHAEELAIRKLNELNLKARADKALFRKRLAQAHATRERAVAAYEEWKEAVQRFREQTAARVRSDPEA